MPSRPKFYITYQITERNPASGSEEEEELGTNLIPAGANRGAWLESGTNGTMSGDLLGRCYFRSPIGLFHDLWSTLIRVQSNQLGGLLEAPYAIK